MPLGGQLKLKTGETLSQAQGVKKKKAKSHKKREVDFQSKVASTDPLFHLLTRMQDAKVIETIVGVQAPKLEKAIAQHSQMP